MYTKAAEEEHQTCQRDTSNTDTPRQTEEHCDAKDVLNGRKIDAEADSKFCLKWERG